MEKNGNALKDLKGLAEFGNSKDIQVIMGVFDKLSKGESVTEEEKARFLKIDPKSGILKILYDLTKYTLETGKIPEDFEQRYETILKYVPTGRRGHFEEITIDRRTGKKVENGEPAHEGEDKGEER